MSYEERRKAKSRFSLCKWIRLRSPRRLCAWIRFHSPRRLWREELHVCIQKILSPNSARNARWAIDIALTLDTQCRVSNKQALHTLPREDDVFFGPDVDLPAMRATEPVVLDLGRGPQFLSDRLTRRREFRCGRTSNQNPFDDRSFLFLRYCYHKIFNQADKRCGLCRCHRATSPF